MRRIVSWLTEMSYRKAWIVIVAVILVVGYGAYTVTRTKEELIPDINFPVLTIVAQDPGGQPSDVTTGVIAPLENATSTLSGLHETDSTAVAGLGVVVLNFNYGTDLTKAQAAVKDAISGAGLGPNVSTSILKFDASVLPVVTATLQGSQSEAELYQIAQTQVKPALMKINGVGGVSIAGGGVSEVTIALDRQKMLDAGVSYDAVATALKANNVILPSGALQTGDTTLPLETVAEYTSLDAVKAIPLRGSNGQSVQLADLAQISQDNAPSLGRNRTNGQAAVAIQVSKTKDANTVSVAHSVTHALNALQLPQGASTTIFQDQSSFITSSADGVIQDGVIGGVLAIIIVFLFLANWRTTIVTAVSIPLSVVIAIVLLNKTNNSLNIMTLGGLTIAIGRVIDDSIVVLENIYRHMARGEKTFPAIINGAREVTIAILGATATTCAVFLPLGLVGGLIGELFLSFALAVVFALIASLLIAVTVIPVLARFAIGGHVKVQEEQRAGDTRLAKMYTPILRWALGHRAPTLTIAALLFIGSLALFPLLKSQFLPDTGSKAITIAVAARPGQTQDAVLAQSQQIEALLPQLGNVKRYQTVITGASGGFSAIGQIISGKSPNSATMTVELNTTGLSKLDAANKMRSVITQQLPTSDNISVSGGGGGFGSSGVQETISADSAASAANLPQAVAAVQQAVTGVKDTANVTSDLASAQPTLDVTVDPTKAAAAGLTPSAISSALSSLSSNQAVTTANLGQGPLPIRLVLAGTDINSQQSLAAFQVAPNVRLDSVATITPVNKQTTITRVNGKPAANVTADITSNNTGAVSSNAQSAVSNVHLPAGITVKTGGVAGNINSGFSSLAVAIVVSIVLVYGVMALLFQSFLTPFVILFSLPLAVIGVLVALAATGTPISISSLIGLLMLVGIVVTNAIVLLEFVIMLQHEHCYSTHHALIEGGQTRVRPILMTALATLLALIPLAAGGSSGALIASDLGRVVIGGLFSSTLLTLVVVPVVYSLVDGLTRRFSRPEKQALGAVQSALRGH